MEVCKLGFLWSCARKSVRSIPMVRGGLLSPFVAVLLEGFEGRKMEGFRSVVSLIGEVREGL